MENRERLSTFMVTASSLVSIAFGLWHFFVPGIWDWYSYVNAESPELVIAIRATNVFFSLSLVLFGALNLLFVYRKPMVGYYVRTLLWANVLLWATRVGLQITYPQGTEMTGLAPLMLFIFSAVLAGYLIPLFIWPVLRST